MHSTHNRCGAGWQPAADCKSAYRSLRRSSLVLRKADLQSAAGYHPALQTAHFDKGYNNHTREVPHDGPVFSSRLICAFPNYRYLWTDSQTPNAGVGRVTQPKPPPQAWYNTDFSREPRHHAESEF